MKSKSTSLFIRCSECGDRVSRALIDEHVDRCDGEPRTPAGECPMCGGRYESYLDHLETCDGG